LIVPGLTIPQRLNYVASMFTYFDAFQKLIYLLTPALILLTGMLPLRVNGWDFIEHWLPYIMLSMSANIALGRDQFRYLRVEQYNLLKMFTFIWASTVLIWPRRLRFLVTPKEAGDKVGTEEWRQLVPHIVVLTVIGVAIALGGFNLLREIDVDTSRRDILFMSLFWALANAALLASGMAAVLHRLHQRRRYRFPAHLNAAVSDGSGLILTATTEDLSQDGVGLITAHSELTSGRQITVTLGLPSGFFAQPGVVMHSRVFEDGKRRVGVQFVQSEPEQRRPLIEYLFVTLPGYARTVEHSMPDPFEGVAAYQPMLTAQERPA
jgi:cellulose synthase (UDP-forming)